MIKMYNYSGICAVFSTTGIRMHCAPHARGDVAKYTVP